MSIQAQSNEVDHQIWLDFTHFFNTGKKSAVGADFGTRGIRSSEDWNQYYIRPTFRYVITRRLDLGVGVAGFYTSNTEIPDLTEWRFFQEVNYMWPDFRFIGLDHRIRYEQRIFKYQTEDLVYQDHNSGRLRYQLSLETIDFDILKQKLYFTIAIEYFQKHSNDAKSFISNSRFLAIV